MDFKRMARPLPRALVAGCLAAAAGSGAGAAGPAPGVAYVSDQKGDIGVIDLATLGTLATISAHGKEPRGIGVTADGRFLVVANREGGRVAVIDRASGALVRQVAVGDNPEFVRVRGHLAFVTCEPSSTGQPPGAPASGAQPAGSGGVPDADSHEPAHIAVVDLDTGRVLRSIVGGLETEGIEFSADGRRLLVANEADDNVSVHDIATGELVHRIDLKPWGLRPRGIKISPDGQRFVVTLELSNAFVVIDSQYRVVKSVKTGEAPYGIAFDPAGKRLFVAAARSRTLQVFDAETFAPIRDVPTGTRCWHFSFTPGQQDILVACGRSGEIVVIDAQTLEPVKRIADGRLPWGVVTFPKASGSLDQVE